MRESPARCSPPARLSAGRAHAGSVVGGSDPAGNHHSFADGTSCGIFVESRQRRQSNAADRPYGVVDQAEPGGRDARGRSRRTRQYEFDHLSRTIPVDQGMSPVQFQKMLRLQEARQLMLDQNMIAGRASALVGYESASQFNREYRRLFWGRLRRQISEECSLGEASCLAFQNCCTLGQKDGPATA